MKNIHYGSAFIDGAGKDVNIRIPAINIDNFNHTVTIITEIGLEVRQRTISMEHAMEIGFINLKALDNHKVI